MADRGVLPTWWGVQSRRQLHGLACVMCGQRYVSSRDWRDSAPRVVAVSRTGSELLACDAHGCADLGLVDASG